MTLFAILILGATLFALLLRFGGRRRSKRVIVPQDVLARSIPLTPDEQLPIRQLCSGLLCLGQTGSGKTTGMLACIIRGLMLEGAGGLVICSKSDDAARWKRQAKEFHRESDLIVLDHTGESRLSFFKTLLANKQATPSTLAMLGAAGWDVFHEVASRGDSCNSGEDAAYWRNALQRMVRSLLLLLLLAEEEVTPAALLRAMAAIPRGAQIRKQGWAKSEWWRASHLYKLLERAHARATANGWLDDYRAVRDFVVSEIPLLSSRTRSVTESMVTGVADSLTKGLAAKLLATDSTFHLEYAIRRNKWIIVDLPIGAWQEVSRYVSSAMVHLCQTALLARHVTAETKPWPIIVDEAQEYLTEHWFKYVSLSRSSRGPMVIATQGQESLAALFQGEAGKHKVETLIGNLATTLVAAPTYETAKWLSERLGQERRQFFSGSTQTDAYSNPLDLLTGRTGTVSGGFSEQMQPRLRADELQALLPPGGPPHWTVRSLVLTGANYRFIDFPQMRG